MVAVLDGEMLWGAKGRWESERRGWVMRFRLLDVLWM